MRLNLRSSALQRGAFGAALSLFVLALFFLGTPSHADLQVNLRADKVELNDGTVIECIVLMETARGVLIAVKDPDKEDGIIQRVIPIANVKKITKGEDQGQMKGLKTEEELARKVIQGSGYRKDGHDISKPLPINPTGPIEVVQPVVGPTKPTGIDVKPVANSKLSPKDVANEYLSRFPDLREAAQVFMGGGERVGELFQTAQTDDPVLHDQLDNFLTLFLKSVEPPDKSQSKQPVKGKPAPPPAKPPAPKATPPANKPQDKNQ